VPDDGECQGGNPHRHRRFGDVEERAVQTAVVLMQREDQAVRRDNENRRRRSVEEECEKDEHFGN
jgi:hypothetical protein